MNKKQIKNWFKQKPGYLKKGAPVVQEMLPAKVEQELISEVQRELRKENWEKHVPDKPVKKLIFDIETSPNIVFSWSIGHKINLSPENIIKERAIICISYKWEDDSKVYSLRWNNGCDKQLLTDFIKVLNTANEVVTHNGNSFDLKWVFGRALYHKLNIKNSFKRTDTLLMARRQFRLNSNKLNYISKFLGLGSKINTTYDLWKDIVLKNDKKALDSMVKYCENDVILLEKVYNKLKVYEKVKI